MRLPKIMCVILIGASFGSVAQAQNKPRDEKPLGTVVIRGSIDRLGQTRMYQLKMVAKRFYEITFNPKNKSNKETVSLRITDNRGVVVAQGAGQGKTVVQFSPIQNGTYKVAIVQTGNRPIGMYSLTIRQRSNAALRPPFTIRGMLAENAPKLPGGKRYHLYKVNLLAGRVYTIEMNGQFDTFLYIKNSADRTLALDDDGGPGLNSKMIYRPTVSGVYRLYATVFSSRHKGAFTLSVK